MGDEISEWRGLGASPVRADAPCGASAKYEPEYEEIQAEVRKLENVSEQRVDWKRVVMLGRGILQQKSKDLLVSSYVCFGLFEDRGYSGLRAGLACLEGMVVAFWEPLYPEATRMRARANALNWMAEKVGAAVSRREPAAQEKDEMAACVQQVEVLEKLLDERMGGDSPDLGRLRRPIKEHLGRMEASEAGASRQPPASSESLPKLTQPVPPAVTDIRSPEDVRRVLKDNGTLIRRAAAMAREQDPTSPWPYRILRALTWLHLDSQPPAANERTHIPPPAPHIVKILQNLLEQGAWADLLMEAESKVSDSPFWLDLHRLSVLALSALGPSYAKAKEAVEGELFNLVRRIPGLPNLQFANGMPLANDETRRWVESVLASSENAMSDPASSQKVVEQGEATDPCQEMRSKALALVKEGRIKEALSFCQKEIGAAGLYREQFLRRLELARLCSETSHLKAAISQLEILDKDITRFHLEEWEPILSFQVIQALWSTLNRMLQDSKQAAPETILWTEELYKRLCRLDLAAALELDSKKKTGWFAR